MSKGRSLFASCDPAVSFQPQSQLLKWLYLKYSLKNNSYKFIIYKPTLSNKINVIKKKLGLVLLVNKADSVNII